MRISYAAALTLGSVTERTTHEVGVTSFTMPIKSSPLITGSLTLTPSFEPQFKTNEPKVSAESLPITVPATNLKSGLVSLTAMNVSYASTCFFSFS